MAQGTGLPLPKGGNTLSQASSINADAVSSAAAWTKIAAAGSRVADSSLDLHAKDVHLQQAGAIAEFENDWRVKGIDARDKFQKDPEGFRTWAESSIDGAVSQVPPWMAPHAKNYLTRTFDGHYSTVLSERRSQDNTLADQSLEARRKTADNDVMALASAGKVGTSEWNAAVAVHDLVLEERVKAKRIAPEAADYLRDDLAGRAQGEVAARGAVQVYREKGFDAAVEHLRTEVRENEKLTLKQAQRDKVFNRGLAAIKLEQQQDKQDRGEIVQASTDLRARIASNQPVDPAEVRDTLEVLQRSGAAAEFKRLSIAHSVHEATAPYRSGLNLKNFATRVAGERVSVKAPNAKPALDFFVSKGWSPAQAAGIVGNLIQENADLNPAQSHDQGTGIGVAGWRLERRNALQTFAAARGTSETDFATQLEFLDHELRTSESKVGEKLRSAKTPAAAAEAFIDFERPAGWTAGNPRAGHGFANRVRNAQAVAGEPLDQPEFVGMPYSGEITKRVQQTFVEQARKAWPDFKARIDQGKVLDADDFTAVRYAAALSGDANWQKEVETLAVSQGVGRQAAALPVAAQQAVVDQARTDLGDTVAESLVKQFDRQRRMVTEDPVGFHVERGGAPPAPLDLSSPQTAGPAIAERVSIARGVAAQQQTVPANPFRPAETAALAGAIASGEPQRGAIALDALAALPDEFLVPAMGKDIREAITSAARSPDAGRFNNAMSFMDRIWTRAPETAKAMFGEEGIHGLMTWQSNLRYLSPDQLAKERERKATDPAARDRMKRIETEGRTEARKVSLNDLVGKFDESWWPLGEPKAPVDNLTINTMLGDYENLYARRYAETNGDKDKASEQALALLKTKWTRSSVNGGRLMLNAPETLRDRAGNPVYPAVDGSHDWMTAQIERDLASELGTRAPSEFDREVLRPPISDDPGSITPERNYTWTLVSDRQTQAEALAGSPASYQVVIADAETGQMQPLTRRFKFDPAEAQGKRRAEFAAERARVMSPRDLPGFDIGAP